MHSFHETLKQVRVPGKEGRSRITAASGVGMERRRGVGLPTKEREV